MSIIKTVLYILLLVKSRKCLDELEAIHYRGISLTWRRLLPIKSNEISLEIFLIIALSDQSISLCDSHQTKQFEISPENGIKCLESWDNCSSWKIDTLVFQCHSKVYEYPKSILSTQINLPISTDSNLNENLYYKFEYSSLNGSCCWEDLDASIYPVKLTSYLNFIERNQINFPPISRFPFHIHIDTKKFHEYSLEIFDPDGDPFECSLLSLIDFISISSKCLITIQSLTTITIERVLLEIEIIEYLNEKKFEIRSRSPYYVIALIDQNTDQDSCSKSPLISLLNIENDQIHIGLNQIINIQLTSMSQCGIEMDECSVMSASQWKIKSQIERANILNNQKEIEYEFEWMPKTNEHCYYQIHCIRCLDHLDNFIDKCLNIFLYGATCQNFNRDENLCSWSSFTSWSKFNQTIYKRQRTCIQTSNSSKKCSFCFGSSFEYQSSLAFIKDFELFEEYLLNPKRGHSTIKIIFISSSISIVIFFFSLIISLYFIFQSYCKTK